MRVITIKNTCSVGLFILLALGFITASARQAHRPPALLTDDECAGILGGNGCPDQNCECANQSCNTSQCSGTSTCASDGSGGCIKYVGYGGARYCGAPNGGYPSGCTEDSDGQCGAQYTGPVNPYYNSCNYPSPPPYDCGVPGNQCGDPFYTCIQTPS